MNCTKKVWNKTGKRQYHHIIQSFLPGEVASELAHRARDAFRRWQDAGDSPELEVTYKELRRALIATIKEQRCRVPAAV